MTTYRLTEKTAPTLPVGITPPPKTWIAWKPSMADLTEAVTAISVVVGALGWSGFARADRSATVPADPVTGWVPPVWIVVLQPPNPNTPALECRTGQWIAFGNQTVLVLPDDVVQSNYDVEEI